MLKKLNIQNIILIESASLDFASGFHAFSGETGAGKTAILQALSLILGARLDTQILRKGEEIGYVEAHFDLKKTSTVYPIIQEALLEIDSSEDLIIRREIRANGKSKIWINCQWTPLHLLKKISPFLIEIVSQHSTQKLLDIDVHRDHLDRFGGHIKLSKKLATLFTQIQNLKTEIKNLELQEKESQTLQKKWLSELEEIEEAKILSEQEEDDLFLEFRSLSGVQERLKTLSQITHILQGQEPSLISTLTEQLNILSKQASEDPLLKDIEQAFKGAIEELKEASLSLLSYSDSLEENPERLEFLNERLKLLNRLKKAFGPSLKEVLATQHKRREDLSKNEDLSLTKKSLNQKIIEAQTEYEALAKTLTQKRIKAKDALEQKMTSLFKELNLPNAEFIIEMKEVHPGLYGNESVEFYLKANIGEKRTSLRQRVSGGELSRVLLCLKILLSELEETPTLIFDEIDTNLGGETAPKIGQLLKKISQSKQVIAITHLPQVAIYATHHFMIQKKQDQKRTFSLVKKLSEKQKILEIERMLGGKGLSQKAQDLAKDLLRSS